MKASTTRSGSGSRGCSRGTASGRRGCRTPPCRRRPSPRRGRRSPAGRPCSSWHSSASTCPNRTGTRRTSATDNRNLEDTSNSPSRRGASRCPRRRDSSPPCPFPRRRRRWGRRRTRRGRPRRNTLPNTAPRPSAAPRGRRTRSPPGRTCSRPGRPRCRCPACTGAGPPGHRRGIETPARSRRTRSGRTTAGGPRRSSCNSASRPASRSRSRRAPATPPGRRSGSPRGTGGTACCCRARTCRPGTASGSSTARRGGTRSLQKKKCDSSAAAVKRSPGGQGAQDVWFAVGRQPGSQSTGGNPSRQT